MTTPVRTYRIHLPSSMGLGRIGIFAAALFVLQTLAGTSLPFALAIGGFVVLSGIAFNLAGGLTTTAGLGVTMLALKIVVISQVAKLIFWQPADSFLERPELTALVLAVGMLSIVLGLVFARNPRPHHGWLPPVLGAGALRAGALLLLVIGGASGLFVFIGGSDAGAEQIRTGGLIGIARQLLFCAPLATVFATASTIVRSDRKRSMDLLVVAAMGVGMTFGVIGGSKTSLFEPVMYYALTCVAWRLPFRRSHLVTLAMAGALAIAVIWPVMQTLKSLGGAKVSLADRIELVADQLQDISSVSDLFATKAEVEELLANDRFQYYGRYIGWLDRFSLIEQDDELIAAVEDQGELGSGTITHAVFAMIPSFIYPEKPTQNTAGLLGRYAGIISVDDEETQISFGIIAESYACFGWFGVLLLPALLIILFTNTTGRLAGPVYENVWTVYLFGRLQHFFVENTISGFIQDALIGSAILFVVGQLVRVVASAKPPTIPTVPV